MAKSKNTILASLLTAAGDIAVSGSGSLTGDLTVQGRLTAQEYHSEIVSASILYTSGSTKFGDSADDTHQFTGSVNISGSILVNGVAAVGPQGATGSQGATGVQGSTGFQGATGIQGSIGPQGNQGPIGPQGSTGSQGATGAQGFQGATGAQGATGTANINGTGFVKADGTTISYDNSTYLTTSSAGTTYVPYTGATSNLNLGNFDVSGRYLNAEGSAGLGGVLHLKQDAAYLARGNGYSTIASSGILFQFFAYTGASTYKDFALRYDGLTDNTTRIYTLPDASGTLALTSNLSSYLPLTGGTLTGQLDGTSAVFSSSVSATGLFGYILKGRSSDNYGAFGFYSNNGATRYGYIQTHSTNGGQFVINGDGGGQITLDSRGIVGTGAVTFSSWLSIGGGSEGLRLGNVGDNSSYDNVKLYYTGFSGGSPIIYLTPRTTPGSGVINTFFHLQNSNGTSTSSNNTMGLLVDGSVGIGTVNNLYGKLSVEAPGNHITMRAPGATAGKYWALDVSSANQFYIINNAGTQYLTITDAGAATFTSNIRGGGNLELVNAGGPYLLVGEGVGVNEYAAVDWDATNNRLRIATQPFAFGANGGQITLTTNGNVGIGLTSPQAILDVSHTAGTTNIIRVSNGSGNYRWRVDQGFSMIMTNASGADTFSVNTAGDITTPGSITISGRTVFTAAAIYDNASAGNNVGIGFGPNSILPISGNGAASSGTKDLGSSSVRWATVFTSDLSLSNGIGDYTIVEGENDLFLYNNKQNKVYKFVIEEVDPSTATPKKS
jgi:hypothetical protein